MKQKKFRAVQPQDSPREKPGGFIIFFFFTTQEKKPKTAHSAVYALSLMYAFSLSNASSDHLTGQQLRKILGREGRTQPVTHTWPRVN